MDVYLIYDNLVVDSDLIKTKRKAVIGSAGSGGGGKWVSLPQAPSV